VPLVVKFPGDATPGREITEPVTSVDVARTIAAALRIRLPEYAHGEDLFEVASNRSPVVARALVATLGDRYATRFGSWTLNGQLGRVPHLCRLDVDPACENDVFATSPIAAVASWQATFEELASEARAGAELSGAKGEPEPAVLSPDVANALIVWGDIR
jgi:arylsulfatase A-like enzyme